MSRKPLALALSALAALAIAGCRRETPDETAATAPPPAAEIAPAPAPAPATPDVVTVVENTAADAITYDSKDFDARDFAGTFSGTLPAGIDATLSLNADGHFVLVERRPPQADAPVTVEGTWTAEQDGKRIRLDPNSKSEEDRLYAIGSNDQIRLLDAAGKPVAGGDAGLRRKPGAQ